MIYTDGIHLMTDGDMSELHDFASKIGLKKSWFQNKDPLHPHYDMLSINIRNKAIKNGAILMSSREMILKCSPAFKDNK